MYELWVVYVWPFSQICMDCVNAGHYKGEDFLESSKVRCEINYKFNDGNKCECYEEVKEEIC